MNEKPVSVALAILTQNERFLMQLRDETSGIAYPGHWGLFGGHLESDETPEEGLKREVLEEIEYTVTNPTKFGCYGDSKIVRYIYHAPLTVPIEQLILHEGWDLALVPPEAIRQGSYYSAKADRTRPLGGIHQQILLDFIKAEL
ncbi:MAG: NUDIX hydrolase [Hydrococcus sp. Prado102]|jgi:8-oxo-dGTP pyrophosphatase MutT (NUDIX family)|nr:NUDIX hydrolase [Hydrococcus sp. Prado102]